MSLLQIAVLAVIQGLAELLPVSSSAHVIVAEKLMGLDPSSPEMTFLLVMLHTGTMLAVLRFFWPRWKERFAAAAVLRPLLVATGATGVVGLALKEIIERIVLGGRAHAEVEALFSNLPLMSASLLAGALVILFAGDGGAKEALDDPDAAAVGALQGLCLPFRGFSRSGATISAGLRRGLSKALAEDFSFALAVVLTPAVIAKEGHRLLKASGELRLTPGLAGMAFSFLAGLAALRWLSSWLEKGRWRWFGYYCLAASAGVLALSRILP